MPFCLTVFAGRLTTVQVLYLREDTWIEPRSVLFFPDSRTDNLYPGMVGRVRFELTQPEGNGFTARPSSPALAPPHIQ